MQEKAKEPEIRFAGFTGAWEQRKFSKLYKRSSEKNDGSIGIERNITVATMQFKSDIRLSSDDYLKTYFTFKVGDIAFEGHQSKEFRYGRFVENDIGDGVVSHIFTVFRPIQRFDLHFWKYAINSENLMQKILSRSTKASTMMHDLVPEDFLNETFLVPSIDEQKAVGKFLHQIDNLLTLHQRKYEKLLNIKKSMLEKMFPKEGEVVPEIRFKGFTGAWEQRKIKDLAANTYGGGTPSTSNPDFWEGSIPWIQSSDLSEHNLFRVRPRKFISQAAVTNSPVKIIPESSIAVITRVGVGKLAVMNFSYTTSQDFLSLSNLNTDVKFTSYQLYRRLQKDLNAVQGTSIKGITKEELLGKNIFIPGRQEQEAIGKFFSKIDSLLTLHQRKWVEFFYPTYF